MPSKTITILCTNDFHGRYYPFAAGPADATSQAGDPGVETPYRFGRPGQVGGFAWLASAVNKIRLERAGQTVLLVHAGDTFSDDLLGNFTQGEAMIRLMNALGYDFLALGNHDFDYGAERTRELAELAKFPMRGANAIDSASGQPFLGEPFLIRQVRGAKIALLALGYHNTPWTTNPRNIRGLLFSDGIEAARRYVPELRRQANIVIVVSHLGAKIDAILSQEVKGIDLIIGGHSHDLLEPSATLGRGRIIQAVSDSAILGESVIQMENGRIIRIAGTGRVLWNDQIEPDPWLAALIEEIRAPYKDRLEEILAVAEEPLLRRYKSESPFDIWVGERLIEETGADLAMLPGLGYGISIQAGPVSRELLYTLLPHPAKLATLKLTGDQIRQILEQCAANLQPDDPRQSVGGLIQTAGLGWTMDLRRSVGERVMDIRSEDRPLASDRLYSVATHSGMLAGIHRYDTFAQGVEIRRTEVELNEVIEGKMRALGKIKPPVGGKLTVLR